MVSFSSKKKEVEEAPIPKKTVKAEITEKPEDICVVEGCSDKKAPGQTHVCSRHVRAG